MLVRCLCWTLIAAAWGCAQNATLQVSPQALSFTASAGGEAATAQGLSVIASDSSLFNFGIGLDGGETGSPAPSWLTVRPLFARTPAKVRVGADPTGLAPGKYTARINLTDAQGRSAATPVTITLQVGASTTAWNVYPPSVNFTGISGNPANALDRQLILRNQGFGDPGAITATVIANGTWLRAAPDPCSGRDCPIRVTAAFPGLPPGTYRGIVRVGCALGTRDVPVVLSLNPSSSVMSVIPAGLLFESRAGAGPGDPRTITIADNGDLVYFWTATIDGNVPWLQLNPPNGSSGPTSPAAVAVTATPGSLPPGVYSTRIRITATDSSTLNAPQVVTVTLRVLDSSAKPVPLLGSGGLLFTAETGSTPPVQPVTLYASSSTLLNTQASPEIFQAQGWLLAEPGAGMASATSPATLNISAPASSLQPGVYTGQVNVALNSSDIRSVNVTNVVTVSSTDRCTPQNVVVAQTALVNNFSVTAGIPAALAVTLLDDCGNRLPKGSVVASFSNGDPGVQLQNLGNGNYAGVWTPRTATDSSATGSLAISLRGSSTGLNAAAAELLGVVTSTALPVLVPGAELNNFSPQVGSPLAPGTVIQIYGSNLAAAAQSAQLVNGRLPTSLGGVSVNIGGVDAPLFYVSPGQLNAQVPAELTPERPYQVAVTSGGVSTAPDTILVTAVAPGIAAFPDGRAIAQDANFALIDPASHPANAGTYLVIYLTGMGATNPAVATGAVAPSSPLAQTVAPPQVTLGGKAIPVIFAGLTPGFAGLYQINFQVPSDTRTGDLALIVTQNGIASNTVTIPVR